MAAVLTDHTIIEYISHTGARLRLSGAKPGTALGAWIEAGDLEGIAHIDLEAIFEGAARQWGQEYAGATLDHAELELPLFILGADVDDFRRRVDAFKQTVRRDRPGWLAVYTNATGWRWVGARLGSLKPALSYDPRITAAAHFELILLIEHPLARTADHIGRWSDLAGTGTGSIVAYPGPIWEAWPQFTFHGPGTLTLAYAGMDMPHPAITATEVMLINTDEARPTIRAFDETTGKHRNLWPLMKGRKYTAPLPAGEVTRIDITVDKPGPATQLLVVCPQHHEGLL